MKLESCIASVLAFLSLFISTSATAQRPLECNLIFSERSVTIALVAADIGTGQKVAGSETVIISADREEGDTSACVATVRVSKISGFPDFPVYSLTAANRQIVASANENIGGPVNQANLAIPASSNRLVVNLQAVAATEWGLEAGRQIERLQLSLIARDGTILDRIPLNLELDIPKTVDVMFVGATGGGQATSIDLGFLSTVETVSSLPFGVRIWSSSGYQFAFSSENRGKLVHHQGSDAIPYDFFVNNVPYPFDRAAPPLGSAGASQPRGDSYSLSIRVPPRRSLAGEYQDRLTVSVSAI